MSALLAADLSARVVANGGSITAGRQTLNAAMIQRGIDNGWWAKTRALWMVAAEDIEGAMTDWQSGHWDAEEIGAGTFTADRGYVSGNIANSLRTTYIPADDATLGQNDASFGCYVRDDAGAAGGTYACGCYDGSGILAMAPRWSNAVYSQVGCMDSSVGDNTIAAGEAIGLTLAERNAGASFTLYNPDGTSSTEAYASTGKPATRFRIGTAEKTDTTAHGYANHEVAFAFVGTYLGSTIVSALRTDVEWYLDQIGAGVR